MAQAAALSAAMRHSRVVEGAHSCLLVVDMQRDFLDEASALCVRGAAAAGVVDACAAAVSKARAAGVPVVWVVREHHASGHDVERTRAHLFDGAAGKGVCIHGSEGARLHEELEPLVDAEADIWLVKTRFSAFFNTNLDSLLRRLGTRTVAICGVQTPNCIRGTAWDALALDYNVVVLSDATASRNAAAQAANLEDMTCAGIHCPTWEGWAPE